MEDKYLTIGLSFLLLVIVVLWFIRFFGEMGVNFGRNRFANWCLGKKDYEGEPLERADIIRIFGRAFLVRILFYLAGVFLCTHFVEYYASMEQFTFQNFLESWERWDARHYINLADLGYQDYIENGQHLFLVFFPLYPWIVRIAHFIISDWRLACLVVSTFAFCIGSVFFYGAVKEEYGKQVAEHSFWLLCLYPFSFFFGGMMTESLFFCFLAAGFFYIQRHKWFVAGVLGIFCSLCRVQGILLLGVGLVEFFVAYRPIEALRQKRFLLFVKRFMTKGIWLFLTIVGNFIYFGINQRVEGDPFRFQVYQKEHWYHETTFVSNCLSEIISYAKGAEESMRIAVWFPELVLFVLAFVCILYSLRRHPLRMSAFLFVYTLVNYSVTFLISGGRYMACALPMFIILAEGTKKQKWFYSLILLGSLCLLGVYFKAYMSGWQVM